MLLADGVNSMRKFMQARLNTVRLFQPLRHQRLQRQLQVYEKQPRQQLEVRHMNIDGSGSTTLTFYSRSLQRIYIAVALFYSSLTLIVFLSDMVIHLQNRERESHNDLNLFLE
jgi:hypothetical protein